MPVFTADSAAEMARKSHGPDSRKPRAHPLAMIVDMQDQLMQAVLDPETEPGKKAQCACAWEKLEDRKRILKGIGVPKPVDTKGKREVRQTTGPIESLRVGLAVHETDTQPEGCTDARATAKPE